MLMAKRLNDKHGMLISKKEIRSFFTRPIGIKKRDANMIIKEMERYGLLEASKTKVEIESIIMSEIHEAINELKRSRIQKNTQIPIS